MPREPPAGGVQKRLKEVAEIYVYGGQHEV